MALKEDLAAAVKKVLADKWETCDGRVVPEPADLRLGNDGTKLKATILYADMAGSTDLVDNHTQIFASEIYKSYLACAARIIKFHDGVITAYDGDRVMAVYLGDYKNTKAAKTALQINHAVKTIINPSISSQYPKSTYAVNHSIGIDTSEVLVSRIGVRNDNDLVWVGRAPNYAAKLSDLPAGYTYITADVYKVLNDEAKHSGTDKRPIWEERKWTAMNSITIYRSGWTWPV